MKLLLVGALVFSAAYVLGATKPPEIIFRGGEYFVAGQTQCCVEVYATFAAAPTYEEMYGDGSKSPPSSFGDKVFAAGFTLVGLVVANVVFWGGIYLLFSLFGWLSSSGEKVNDGGKKR